MEFPTADSPGNRLAIRDLPQRNGPLSLRFEQGDFAAGHPTHRSVGSSPSGRSGHRYGLDVPFPAEVDIIRKPLQFRHSGLENWIRQVLCEKTKNRFKASPEMELPTPLTDRTSSRTGFFDGVCPHVNEVD